MINEKLFKAVEQDSIAEVEKALTEEKINATSYYGAKSIVLATENGNFEMLKMLLESSAKIPRVSFWSNSYNLAFSTLTRAVKDGRIDILKLLLEYGANADKKILNSPLLLCAINTGNKEMEIFLKEYGFCISKKNLVILDDAHNDEIKTEPCCEDGIFIPEKGTKDNALIQYVKDGQIEVVKYLLNEGKISAKALLKAIDVAVEKNKIETATILWEYCNNSETEIYVECLKENFLRASCEGDSETVKFYLEKLIENAVGVLADETGRSTLEIALENNPADIIKILTNYGFHENSLQHAYRCLSGIKKCNNTY